VLLQQPYPEQLLDHGAEGNAGIAQQSCGELGVEQSPGSKPDLVQTRQVLTGGMDHPLGLHHRGTECRKIGWLAEGSRIHQMRPCPGAPQLDEIGALAVAEAVCPFCVHGDRPSPAAQRGHCLS
jgi:hypothetical protein